MEVDIMDGYLNHLTPFNEAFIGGEIKGEFDGEIKGEINAENTLLDIQHEQTQNGYTIMRTDVSNKSLTPDKYFSITAPHLPKLLVPPESFSDIRRIAGFYPEGLTDFLGFECRLNREESQVDWALAISGRGNARYVLADFLNNGHFPEAFKQKPEWQQIQKFSRMWTDPESILHNKILGAWLEFDMVEDTSKAIVPSVFFNPANINGETVHDPAQYEWFTKKAIPLLIGRRLPKKAEQNLQDCIRKMPRKASLFIVGVMLSRETSDIRMSITFRDSQKIMPYLKEIGWSDDETETFATLIKELDAKNVNRMVLDFDVGKKIGKKIAVECSFYPNRFHKEERWKELLDFLVEKGIVTPEKRDELLCFPGDDPERPGIIRYITHVKIVYEPGKPLKAKAYLAIRHFRGAYMNQ